jgi:hypothetical protein
LARQKQYHQKHLKRIKCHPILKQKPAIIWLPAHSPDSKKIAAAYHYSHEGQYTWVGIWDIESGNLIDTKRRSGWTTDIFWVFQNESN